VQGASGDHVGGVGREEMRRSVVPGANVSHVSEC
jgi:hypothetical protein